MFNSIAIVLDVDSECSTGGERLLPQLINSDNPVELLRQRCEPNMNVPSLCLDRYLLHALVTDIFHGVVLMTRFTSSGTESVSHNRRPQLDEFEGSLGLSRYTRLHQALPRQGREVLWS